MNLRQLDRLFIPINTAGNFAIELLKSIPETLL